MNMTNKEIWTSIVKHEYLPESIEKKLLKMKFNKDGSMDTSSKQFKYAQKHFRSLLILYGRTIFQKEDN